ncbi:MAG: hypothetical protein AAF125_26665, partial [Chloroflexota bacterium]
METQQPKRQFPWFATLLIVWNILDIIVHVAIDLAEPWRIAGNVVGIAAALIVLFGIAKPFAPHLLGVAAVVVVVLNMVHSVLHGWLAPSFIFIGVSLILQLLWAQNIYRRANTEGDPAQNSVYTRWWAALSATALGIVLIALVGEQGELELGIAPLAELHSGELIAADYWRDEPLILSAGMGFEGIIGLPEINEASVRDDGGSWYGSVECTSGEEPDDAAYTSAAPSDGLTRLFKGFSEDDDGLPIVFSWPVATETVDLTDFQFTLNTGEIVFPNSIGMWPNWELNERNVVVGFGDFGNRGMSSEDDAIFPVRLDIVADD